MKKTENLINTSKEQLIAKLKEETKQEIEVRVREFENHLREMANSKIVSFVDSLKIIAKTDFDCPTPKVIIEVHL
jgi:F0F1-type ATP synthase membrane subunit b/b'